MKNKILNNRKPEAAKVIYTLHSMLPVKSRLNESKVEYWCMRISTYMLVIATLMLVVLGCGVLWNNYVRLLGDIEKAVMLYVAVVALTLPIFSLILSIVSNAWTLVSFQKDSLIYFMKEIENDQKHVTELCSFAKTDLDDALKIIRLKIVRIKNKVGFFIGAPDKVALFSLAAMGWAVIKEFSNKEKGVQILSVSQLGFSLTTLLQYAAAFFTGIALGAILLNRHLQRYIYQSELLEMAISIKEQNLLIEDK